VIGQGIPAIGKNWAEVCCPQRRYQSMAKGCACTKRRPDIISNWQHAPDALTCQGINHPVG